MKSILIIGITLMIMVSSVWGLDTLMNNPSVNQENLYFQEKKTLFQQNIPAIAEKFRGIPYSYGGNPLQSKNSDNSHLFFAIYKLAAQKAGLMYKQYMPMKNFLQHLEEVDENNLKNGDLMVLNDDHAAMIYHVETNGKIHLIYASEMRRKILTFHSENPVFDVYWLENLNGFFRLSDALLETVDQ